MNGFEIAAIILSSAVAFAIVSWVVYAIIRRGI